MSFANPIWLLLIPILIAFVWWANKRQGFLGQWPAFRANWLQRQITSRPTWRTRTFWIPNAAMWAGLAFLIVALARPQKEQAEVKRNLEGIDIMIVLDISDSMTIEDMKPLNRLEAAKETIRQFVSGRTSDRIGIIVFAGESFTLVPLTLDYPLILARIADLTTAQKARIKDGTAIGVALANGAGRLKDSVAKSRVLIFLTDGENNSGTIDPETGLEIAKGYGIKIYSVGIGQDGPTRIPIVRTDPFGREVKMYQPFESRVNDDLLSRMATETGGRYFRATQPDSLQKVFQSINQLEKTVIEENRFVKKDELFAKFAIWGFLLCLFGWVGLRTAWRTFP